MNRMEFMRQLELLLSGISQSERQEALQYYNDYFNDAGVENEGEVMRALGSPAKVAEIIKAGLSDKTHEDWEFTETGFRNGADGRNDAISVIRQSGSEGGQQNYYQGNQQNNGNYYKAKKNDSNNTVIIVILAIVLSPIWIPIAASVIGVLISVIATLVCLLFALGICGIAFLVSGVVLAVLAVAKVFVAPMVGICLFGVGMLLIGIGILFCLVTGWICAKAIPVCVRGMVHLCKLPFEKRGGQVA